MHTSLTSLFQTPYPIHQIILLLLDLGIQALLTTGPTLTQAANMSLLDDCSSFQAGLLVSTHAFLVYSLHSSQHDPFKTKSDHITLLLKTLRSQSPYKALHDLTLSDPIFSAPQPHLLPTPSWPPSCSYNTVSILLCRVFALAVLSSYDTYPLNSHVVNSLTFFKASHVLDKTYSDHPI